MSTKYTPGRRALEIGDTVTLRSGSPHMTIVRYDSCCFVCAWFDAHGNGQHQVATFPEKALDLEEPLEDRR